MAPRLIDTRRHASGHGTSLTGRPSATEPAGTVSSVKRVPDSTLAWIRWSREWGEFVVVVCNFTPVAWEGYRLAVPYAGRYEVVLDSGAEAFGGAGALEATTFETVDEPHLGREQYVELTLPPLTMLTFALV